VNEPFSLIPSQATLSLPDHCRRQHSRAQPWRDVFLPFICAEYRQNAAAVSELVVFFYIFETAGQGRNRDPRTCCDIAHGRDCTVVAVITVDVIANRGFCFISDVFYGAANEEALCFNIILRYDQVFTKIIDIICFKCFLCFLWSRHWAVNNRHKAAHAANAG